MAFRPSSQETDRLQIYDNTKFHILQYGVLHKLFPSNLYNLIFSSAAAFRSVASLPGRNTMRRLPLRSPPRMRGKVIVRSRNAVQIGITPAYAGKSARILKRRTEKRDHPRVCGEKSLVMRWMSRSMGSPPRMRGKAASANVGFRNLGITPAYAGKRRRRASRAKGQRDHPRVCGEKEVVEAEKEIDTGSPPRMRGKGPLERRGGGPAGITPAYAGKRLKRSHRIGHFSCILCLFHSVLHRASASGGSRAGPCAPPCLPAQNAVPV